MFSEYIWGSSKILEFTIRSMISRQQYGDSNVMIQRSEKTRDEIETSVREVIEPFGLPMNEAGIELLVKNKIQSCESTSYLANWDMLNQALFHPMVNAVKFNKKDGQIKLTLQTRRINDQQAYLQCILKDTGIGIAPDKIKSLFTAFNLSTNEMRQPKQSGGFTFRSTQGIGLGLSTTKSLLQVQGGNVTIESEVSQFTKLTLSIKV